MNRSMWMAALLVVMIALVGCQSQESADAGPGAAPEPQAEEEGGGPLEALAFWNWFGGDEEEEAEVYYDEEAEEGGGPLEALAFWNWFGGDGEDEPDPITADMIRADMSPAMDHVAHSGEEAKNQTAKTIDDNGRQAWDDLWRALLLDRPARGSPYGIP